MIHFQLPPNLNGVVECEGASIRYLPPPGRSYGGAATVEALIKAMISLYEFDDMEYHTTPAYKTLAVLQKNFPDGVVLNVADEGPPEFVPRNIAF